MLSTLAAFACVAGAAASTWGKPLRFRADGTFKAVEVSDVHFIRALTCKDISPAQEKYPCSDVNATMFFRTLIAEEDPDVFIFTGDNVCNGDLLGGKDAINALLVDFLQPNATVPWVAVEGNHDGESGINYAEVAAYLLTLPNGLNEPNPEGCYGNTNFALQVFGPASESTANSSLLNLYMIDSNSYSTLPQIGGYGWVHLDQTAWFTNTSATFAAQAAAQGLPQAPALAFQHIPLPEHQYLLDAKVPIIGQYHETVCCPAINSGLFTAFLTAGDVKAVTVGHDHTNDYCGAWNGIQLCYDGHGNYGQGGYGEPDWPIRARVWHASAFGSVITTYKHLDALAGGIPVPNVTVDLQTVWSNMPLAGAGTSQTAGNPLCPPGMNAVMVDINKDAGGTYSYVCTLPSTDATTSFVNNITVAIGSASAPPVCPSTGNWTQVPGNMKEGTVSTAVMNLCYLLGPPSAGVVTALTVAQGGAAFPVACPPGFTVASGDLSGGVGLHENLCMVLQAWSPILADRVASHSNYDARVPSSWGYSSQLPADKSAYAPRKASMRVAAGAD